MTTSTRELRYQVAQGWAQLPVGWDHPDVVPRDCHMFQKFTRVS